MELGKKGQASDTNYTKEQRAPGDKKETKCGSGS